VSPAASYASGLYDQGRGYVIVHLPPLPPGLVRLSISLNRQQFRYVPGTVPIHFGTRVHVKPLSATENGNDNEVTIFYAPPPHLIPPTNTRHSHYDKIHVKIQSITVTVRNVGDVDNDDDGKEEEEKEEEAKEKDHNIHKGTLESARVIQMIPVTTNYGRYTYSTPYIVQALQTEIEIVRFSIHYTIKTHHHHSTQQPPPFTHSNNIVDVWEDDNNGHGYAWRFLSGLDGTTQWLEGSTSALQAGAYFNRIHSKHLDVNGGMILVRIVGSDVVSGEIKLNQTMPGKYLIKEGSVRWVIPASPKFDGRAHVSISMNGGAQWTTTSVMDVYATDSGPSHYAFDARYILKGGSELKFRLSTEALRTANITYPFNLIGREQFDRRIIFDISECIGIARDRLVVMETHADTGKC